MIKQESTYDKETYEITEFKEFNDGFLLVHEKFTDEGIKVFERIGEKVIEYIQPIDNRIKILDMVTMDDSDEKYIVFQPDYQGSVHLIDVKNILIPLSMYDELNSNVRLLERAWIRIEITKIKLYLERKEWKKSDYLAYLQKYKWGK